MSVGIPFAAFVAGLWLGGLLAQRRWTEKGDEGFPPDAVEGAEALARRFHEAYERLAPAHGYETRSVSAVPWEQVPEQNRRLMIAVCAELFPAPKPPPEALEGARGLCTKLLGPIDEGNTEWWSEMLLVAARALTDYRDAGVREERERLTSCCKRCAQAVLDPACIFCGKERVDAD
jgi:hypothetical protein